MSSSYLGQSPVFGDFPFQILSGDGTAVYTLNFKSSGTNGVLVFLNGAVQRPGTDFSVVGDQLTFQANVASGVQIFVYGMGLPKSSLAPSMGSVSEAELSAALKADRISGKFSELSMVASGLNLSATITANYIALLDASFNQKVVRDVNVSLDLSVAGAGGLDAGVVAGNTWYAVYVIYNPTTGVVSAVASLSFTAPTLPSGYTHWAFIEAVRINAGATQISPINMVNGICYYNPTVGTPIPNDFPIALSGGTSTTLTAISLAALVPPSAKEAILGYNCAGPSTGTSVLRMSSSGASGLIAIAVATGAQAGRIQVDFPNPSVFTPHYSVAGSGLATILVSGWRS